MGPSSTGITSRRGGYLPASVHDTLAKSTAVTSWSPQRQSAVRLGGDGETPRRALQRALDQNPLIRLRNADDLAASAGGGDITLLLDLLYGLLAMAVVIAVLGVVNTLAMSVSERTREIGMLRAVGHRPEQTKRMIHLESVLISLFGALLGIGAGIFLGWAAGRLASGSIQGYEMVIPWGRIAVALAGAALVGLVAGLWPARRAARLNVLTALKAD